MINETITIASNFTANLTKQIMSWENLSNFTPGLMNLASEIPKYSGWSSTDSVISVIGGLMLLAFGYIIKSEIKDRKKEICPKCANELKLIKCLNKKCSIKICEACNLKDAKNSLMDMCGICGKYVCKEHSKEHIHKPLNLIFHSAKTIMDKNQPQVVQEPEIKTELLPIEYYGGNKEIVYILEPKTLKGTIYGQDKEERNMLANTLLKLKEEGYSLKGYIYDFYILEKQGNILPPPLIDVKEKIEKEIEKPLNLEGYDIISHSRNYEEMDVPAEINWGEK